jgi:cytochrome c oxidase subunit 3
VSVVAEQFESAERQRQSAELGMWVFLATEIMFFAPLFLGYAYGRWAFGDGFAAASRHTDVVIGTINTAVLLTSSLMMALAVRASKLQQRRATVTFLLLTAALGVAFLTLKGLEYHDEWQEHLIPWIDFRFEAAHRSAAALFYFLYFGMTGLHAIHLTIGVSVMGIFAVRAHRHNVAALQNQIENGALYWHFVDSIWVFLYPIIYLVERHG